MSCNYNDLRGTDGKTWELIIQQLKDYLDLNGS